MEEKTKEEIFHKAYGEEFDLQFHWVMDHPTRIEHERRHGRSEALAELIEDLGLTEEYKEWKETKIREARYGAEETRS